MKHYSNLEQKNFLSHVLLNPSQLTTIECSFFEDPDAVKLVSILKSYYADYAHIPTAAIIFAEWQGRGFDNPNLKAIRSWLDTTEYQESPDYWGDKFAKFVLIRGAEMQVNANIEKIRTDPEALAVEWGLGLPETIDAPLQFPVQAFPPFCQELISELHLNLHYEPSITSCALISAMATTLGRKYCLQVKQDWYARPIFWFSCIGMPGTKKSHPIKTLLKPLFNIHSQLIKEWQLRNDDSKPKQIIFNDSTMEALGEGLANNPKGILKYHDELLSFFKSMDQYRPGSDRQKWLELFNENNSVTINRVTKKLLHMEKCMVNIIGTIQPGKVARYMNGDEDGMAHRFLYTQTDSNIETITFESKPVTKLYEYYAQMEALYAWLAFEQDTDEITIQLTPTLEQQYIKNDAQLIEIMRHEDNALIQGYISKLRTYYPRFIIVLAALDHFFTPGFNIPAADELFNSVPLLTITPEIMERAHQLCLYFHSTFTTQVKDNTKLNEMETINKSMDYKGLSTKEKVKQMVDKGLKVKDIAAKLQISERQVYKLKR